NPSISLFAMTWRDNRRGKLQRDLTIFTIVVNKLQNVPFACGFCGLYTGIVTVYDDSKTEVRLGNPTMTAEALLFLLVGGLLCALGALGGTLTERRRLQLVIREQAARNSELRHRFSELEAIIERERAENKTLSSFLVVLPDVVKRL